MRSFDRYGDRRVRTRLAKWQRRRGVLLVTAGIDAKTARIASMHGAHRIPTAG